VIVRRCLPLLLVALGAGACDAAGPVSPAPPATTAAASAATAFGGTDRAWIEINIAMNEELAPLLDLADNRSQDPDVRAQVAKIAAENTAELGSLYELHDAAGLPPENPHKGMPMPGMVTPAQVAEAQAASGAAFEKLLNGHITAHFEQGKRLATSEGTAGVEPRTKALAARMATVREQYLAQLSKSE
jgi:hypothetical protein